MPQDRPIKPARLQSPGTAERRPSLGERLRASAPKSAAPATPPAKKGVLSTLSDRWAPVRKYAPTRSR